MAKNEVGKVNKGGRPKKVVELAALDAVNRAMPPEKIQEVIEKTWGWCEEHKSVNGAIKLLTLTLSYQLGQPVKRVVSTKMKISDLINQVTDIDDDAFDDAIEAIYENSDK